MLKDVFAKFIEEITLIVVSWVIRARWREIQRFVLKLKASYFFLNSYIWCFLCEKSILRAQRNHTLNLECKKSVISFIFPYIFCNFDTFELQKMYGNIMNIMEYRGIPFHRKEFQASDMSCLSVAQLVSRVSKAYIELHSVVFYTSFNLRCWYGGTFVRKLKSRN